MDKLRDVFGREHTYLRISVTDRCNLRCHYCMPEEGIRLKPPENILTFEEIIRLSAVFAGLGIDKIRLTGGEPLVRDGFTDLARSIAAIPGISKLGVTTNGVLLGECARELRDAGVNRVNISLDTLRPDRFELIARRKGLERVLAGIDASLAAGFDAVRLNVVVIRGMNDDEVPDFAQLARDKELTVRFIEYMPYGQNGWDQDKLVSTASIRRQLEQNFSLSPYRREGEKCYVAREFKVDGFAGKLGFIAGISEHFCERCNRLRIAADGRLKTCLHYASEVNLRDLMREGRSDDYICEVIAGTMSAKREGPMGHLTGLDSAADDVESCSMHEIGG